MSGHEPTLKNKVSPHIQGQLPEFVQQDHPLFSLFLKYYYEFLEAGELVVTALAKLDPILPARATDFPADASK